jgi:nicotinamide-nucleotide adenylyltransferase
MVKTGLFVGRFQPFHKGHLGAIKYSLKKVEELIIIVGSAQLSHDTLNPFTAGERITMIKVTLKHEKIDDGRYIIIPVPDVNMHSIWFSGLKSYVPNFDVVFSNDPLTRRLGKEDGLRIENIPFIQREKYRSTEIRKRILINKDWEDLIPVEVSNFIKEIKGDERIRELDNSDR